MTIQYIIFNYRNPETNKIINVRDVTLFSSDSPILDKYIETQMNTRYKTFTLYNENVVYVLPKSYTMKNHE